MGSRVDQCEWRAPGCTAVPEYVVANPDDPSALRFALCGNCAEWFNPDWRTWLPWPAASSALTSREAMVLRAIVGNRAQTVTPQLLAVAIPMPLANVRVLLAGLAARGLVVVDDARVGLYLTDVGRRAVGA